MTLAAGHRPSASLELQDRTILPPLNSESPELSRCERSFIVALYLIRRHFTSPDWVKRKGFRSQTLLQQSAINGKSARLNSRAREGVALRIKNMNTI